MLRCSVVKASLRLKAQLVPGCLGRVCAVPTTPMPGLSLRPVVPRQGGKACLDPAPPSVFWLRIGAVGEVWVGCKSGRQRADLADEAPEKGRSDFARALLPEAGRAVQGSGRLGSVPTTSKLGLSQRPVVSAQGGKACLELAIPSVFWLRIGAVRRSGWGASSAVGVLLEPCLPAMTHPHPPGGRPTSSLSVGPDKTPGRSLVVHNPARLWTTRVSGSRRPVRAPRARRGAS